MPGAADRTPRSDARRNRARLTEVAAAAFRDEGLDVGVDELARRAGVGVATLYRHFPAKTDLIHAVADLVLDDLEAAAAGALASGQPAGAVARFLRSALALERRNGGLLHLVADRHLPADRRRALGRRARAILAPVVRAGHESGAIRRELGAADLLVVLRMLSVASTASRRRSPEYLSLLLRGLADPSPDPLGQPDDDARRAA